VFARSADRVAKERGMRRRQLKWLWARLKQLSAMNLTREELLMKLGAARQKTPTAWRLVTIDVSPDSARFGYRLDRNKLRLARRREGRYLLRTNLTEHDRHRCILCRSQRKSRAALCTSRSSRRASAFGRRLSVGAFGSARSRWRARVSRARAARAWTLRTLYSFCAEGGANCTDGAGPLMGLVTDKWGNLFGATPSGGAYGHASPIGESVIMDRRETCTPQLFSAALTVTLRPAREERYGSFHPTLTGQSGHTRACTTSAR
jgi:hypothetical protein